MQAFCKTPSDFHMGKTVLSEIVYQARSPTIKMM